MVETGPSIRSVSPTDSNHVYGVHEEAATSFDRAQVSRLESNSSETSNVSLTWDSTATTALAFLDNVEKDIMARQAATSAPLTIPQRPATVHLALPDTSMDCLYTPPGTPRMNHRSVPRAGLRSSRLDFAAADSEDGAGAAWDAPANSALHFHFNGLDDDEGTSEDDNQVIRTPPADTLVGEHAPWFMVEASRDEVHQWAVRLLKFGPIGSFLIRTPSSRPDHYALVLKVAKKSVKNFLIRKHGSGRVSLSGKRANCLADLVELLADDVGVLPVRLLPGFDLFSLLHRENRRSDTQEAGSEGRPRPRATVTPTHRSAKRNSRARFVGTQFVSATASPLGRPTSAGKSGTPTARLSKADFTPPPPVLPSRSEEAAEMEMVAQVYDSAIPPLRSTSSPLPALDLETTETATSPICESLGQSDEAEEMKMVADVYNQVIARGPSSPDDDIRDDDGPLPSLTLAAVRKSSGVKVADLITERHSSATESATSSEWEGIYYATHSFDSQGDAELALEVGTLVSVIQTPEGGWWQGATLEDDVERIGWFPSSHVTPYSETLHGQPLANQRSPLPPKALAPIEQPVTRFDSADSSVDMDEAFEDPLDNVVPPPPEFV